MSEPFDWDAWLHMSKRNRPHEGEQGAMFNAVPTGARPKPIPGGQFHVELMAALKADRSRLTWDEHEGRYELQQRERNEKTGKWEWATQQFFTTLADVGSHYNLKVSA